jgi:hypothetical protein
MVAARRVEAEVLDELAPDDQRARASRRDLRRIHRAMQTVSILRTAIARLSLRAPPRRILELGAGDGSVMMRLARVLRPRWTDVELTLLDRHDLLDTRMQAAYADVGWRVDAESADVFTWARGPVDVCYDLVVTTLFLHHFEFEPLRVLCAAIAARTRAFVACEPRRGRTAALGSRLVGLLGANAVTRGDAVKSVAAGFTGQELRACWPAGGAWRIEEFEAGFFSHCLVARHAD